MKQKLRRLVSFMICALLVAGNGPDAALLLHAGAEEAEQIVQEAAADIPAAHAEAPAPDPTEAPTQEPTEAPTEAPTPEPTEAPTPEPTEAPTSEPTEAPTQEPTEAPAPENMPEPTAEANADAQIDPKNSIDYAQSADHSPNFHEGYAMILRDDVSAYDSANPDAEIIAYLSKGVVWVLNRTDADARRDRLKIAFCADAAEDTIIAWADAKDLRPMDPGAETEAYIEKCNAADEIEYADSARNHPILPITCEFAQAEEAESESDSEEFFIAAAAPAQDMILTAATLSPGAYLTIAAAPANVGARMQGEITVAHEPGHGSHYELEYDAAAIELTEIEPDIYAFTAKSISVQRTVIVRAVNERGAVLGSTQIEVYPAPEQNEVFFDRERYDFGIGDAASHLTAQTAPGRYCEFLYSSSDPEKVSIDAESGAISANAVTADGESVTITACDRNNPDVRVSCNVFVHSAPESIRFNAESIRMAEGECANLYARMAASPESSAIGLGCTFESSDPDIASVDADGTLTANACGTATITARAYSGAACTVRVRVMQRGGAASLSPAFVSMGEKSDSEFSIAWPEGCANLYTLEYDAGIISIESIQETANGDIVHFRSGESDRIAHTRINVLDAGGIAIASLPVDVAPAPYPGDVYFAEADQLIEIGIGESGRIAQAHCADGKMCDFIYTSDDPAHVLVDQTGKLVPVAITEGDQCAIITATAKNNPEAIATCRVIVTNAPESVYFEKHDIRIGIGEQFDLRDAGLALVPETAETRFKFTSTDAAVVQADADGIIEGISAGTALIHATTHNGKNAYIFVTVAEQSGAPAFEKQAYRIGEGMRMNINVLHGDNYRGSYSVESDSDLLIVLSVDRNASGTDVISLSAASVSAKTDVNLYLTRADGAMIADCTVSVLPAPDSIACVPDAITIGIGESAYLIKVVNTPADTMCSYSYKSDHPEIISVDADGKLTAKSFGAANIRVRASGSGAEAMCAVTVLNAPTFVLFDQESYLIDVTSEEPVVLNPIINEGCETSFTYQVADEAIATVDPDGTVHGHIQGITTVTVTTHNGLTASAELNVRDPLMPTSLAWAEGFPPAYMVIGASAQMQIVYEPETAMPEIVWSSSDEKIATVDPATGLVTAVSYGYVTITAASQRNPELVLSFTMLVLSNDVCMKIPERRIDYSNLNLNNSGDYNALISHMNSILSDITDIQDSANDQLEILFRQGVLSSEWERNARKADITRGFAMYRFPWDTTSYQSYWKAANSEGGAKDFKPNIVYFGPAYTQTNRAYNVERLLSEGRYYSLGNGGYRLDRSRLVSGTYCGNDCSSFVSMCLWGNPTEDTRAVFDTRKIATSDYYFTVSDWTDLRPGDLINSYGHHVVMFLYYTNDAKTQMMILEQGGGEFGVNTCSCSIRGVAYYRDGGYSIRRYKGYGK